MQDNIFILPAREPTEPGRTSTHNLPAQLTPLIGREQEIAAACTLLRRPDVRLVTITGTGGVGKTRLALQVATDLLDDFADGVSYISLAPISDLDLVIPTITQALGIKERGARPLKDLLKAYLRDKHLLLLLDNFEQILPAVPHLTDLLTSCPHLSILVTSRATLHVQGEHEFPVSPLAFPDLAQLPEPEVLSHYAAVALFLQRAQAVKPDFQLTANNARAIVEICARLDGLPLAIELAATRIKLLPPQALLARLGQRLTMLTRGARDAPARQQTLRDTIAWSYNLLDAYEQRLFQRLSVFVGGCTLEAIEALCAALDTGPAPISVLHAVASLIDKNLLQQGGHTGGEPRLLMLETPRAYGLECLTASGQLETMRRAHTDYYLRLAEEAGPELLSPQQSVWFERFEQEHENLRAVMNWLLERAEGGKALRLATALGWFWFQRGHWSEGRTFLERALAGTQGEVTPLRAQALLNLGDLILNQGELDRTEQCYRECLALARQLEDTGRIGTSLGSLGYIALIQGNYAAAKALLEEGVPLSREAGDRFGAACSLTYWSIVALYQGDYVRARALAEECLALFRDLGSRMDSTFALIRLVEVSFFQGDLAQAYTVAEECLVLCIEEVSANKAETLCLLGKVVLQQGDSARAHALAGESLALSKEVNEKSNICPSLSLLGRVTSAQGNYAAARAYYEQSLQVAREGDFKWEIACGLEGLASVVAAQDELAWAARLWGAAAALRKTIGAPLPPVYRPDYEQSVAAARTQLGEQTFASAWAEGRAMTPDQALAARGPAPVLMPDPMEQPSPSPAKSAVPYPDGLIAREVEVLRLVAHGLTNAQVAEQLVIRPFTVNNHIRSIFGKLGVTNRAAATRYAVEHNMV